MKKYTCKIKTPTHWERKSLKDVVNDYNKRRDYYGPQNGELFSTENIRLREMEKRKRNDTSDFTSGSSTVIRCHKALLIQIFGYSFLTVKYYEEFKSKNSFALYRFEPGTIYRLLKQKKLKMIPRFTRVYSKEYGDTVYLKLYTFDLVGKDANVVLTLQGGDMK